MRMQNMPRLSHSSCRLQTKSTTSDRPCNPMQAPPDMLALDTQRCQRTALTRDAFPGQSRTLEACLGIHAGPPSQRVGAPLAGQSSLVARPASASARKVPHCTGASSLCATLCGASRKQARPLAEVPAQHSACRLQDRPFSKPAMGPHHSCEHPKGHPLSAQTSQQQQTGPVGYGLLRAALEAELDSAKTART
jgi:hypothetical protein